MATSGNDKTRSTAPLRVLCRSNLRENRINIHPNDGFDLGFMTTRYTVAMEEGRQAEVWLLNECPLESVELSTADWERLGKPKAAILRYDGTLLRVEKA